MQALEKDSDLCGKVLGSHTVGIPSTGIIRTT